MTIDLNEIIPGKIVEFRNNNWLLKVEIDRYLNPNFLQNLDTGELIADENYLYQLEVKKFGSDGYQGDDKKSTKVIFQNWNGKVESNYTNLTFTGTFDFGNKGPTDILIEHNFRLYSDQTKIEEWISIVHPNGYDSHSLPTLRFGFQKIIFNRQQGTWIDYSDQKKLTPVPFRRHVGQVDYKMSSYSSADLFPNWLLPASEDLPQRGSEAWLWGDNNSGLLISKYSQNHIEYSTASGKLTPQDSDDELISNQQPTGNNLCLIFGGVGLQYGEPELSKVLEPYGRIDFGVSTIEFYLGSWESGYAKYREQLRLKGHGLPPKYSPRIHWNELYNLGWRGGSNSPLQNLEQIWDEARIAKEAGAESFYFDPGWDYFEGSTQWDESRLGELKGFVKALKQNLGLELALHQFVHTKSTNEDPTIYRRNKAGEINIWQTPGELYAGGNICTSSKTWQAQKIDRLCKLAEDGVTFLMFDFMDYGRYPDSSTYPIESCWSTEHGHEVPLSRLEHTKGVMNVIAAVKKKYPHVIIESHDRIAGGLQDFLPLYFQHGGDDSYDEIWGFEYMWDPLHDLISGKALSLYEYNLAYIIPLYLHINSAHDLPSMLSFWWYASTCRHIGVGGVKPGDDLWPLLTDAISQYKRIRNHLTSGDFIGIDQLTHFHTSEKNSGVFNLFNLTSKDVEKKIVIPLEKLNMSSLDSIQGAVGTIEGEFLIMEVLVPSMSPVIIEVNI
jgi:hypothetical protein